MGDDKKQPQPDQTKTQQPFREGVVDFGEGVPNSRTVRDTTVTNTRPAPGNPDRDDGKDDKQ